MIAPDTLAKIALSPVLIPQGLRIRKRALILEEADGPRSGRVGQGPALRLLILGDSSAAGVGVDRQEDALAGHLTRALGQGYSVDWALWAKCGATTPSTLQSLSERPPEQFDVAVSALGVNDVTRGLSVSRWLAGQRAIFETLQSRHGVRQIFVTGLPPLGRFPLLPQPMRAILGAQALRYDAALCEMTQGRTDWHHYTLDLPDDPTLMARDGFHPGPVVYGEWGRQLADRMRAIL